MNVLLALPTIHCPAKLAMQAKVVGLPLICYTVAADYSCPDDLMFTSEAGQNSWEIEMACVHRDQFNAVLKAYQDANAPHVPRRTISRTAAPTGLESMTEAPAATTGAPTGTTMIETLAPTTETTEAPATTTPDAPMFTTATTIAPATTAVPQTTSKPKGKTRGVYAKNTVVLICDLGTGEGQAAEAAFSKVRSFLIGKQNVFPVQTHLVDISKRPVKHFKPALLPLIVFYYEGSAFDSSDGLYLKHSGSPYKAQQILNFVSAATKHVFGRMI